jgi:histidyl-tRNA synthetase
MDKSLAIHYQGVAAKLRAKGIAVEVFPDAKKIGQQYAVTDAKGVKWGILIGTNEAEKNVLTLKKLETREQFPDMTVEQAAEKILSEK